jgi:galactokinase
MGPAQLAQLCQQAEHEYAGVRSGIMDQFVALHGAAGHALLLDCRSLQYELVPLPAELRLVTCNTMVQRTLKDEYNQRRADCEEAVRLLSAPLPGIRALRDVSPAQLEQHRRALPERIYHRARHVVTENARTEDAAAALREGDLARFGRRMAESHASLRDDYEVSCKELDLMTSIAVSLPGVVGARLTGGGFGGCVVALVHTRHAEEFHARVADEYARQTGRLPQILVFEAAAAAGEVAPR